MEAFDKSLRSYGDQDVVDIKYEPFTADILHRIKGVCSSHNFLNDVTLNICDTGVVK